MREEAHSAFPNGGEGQLADYDPTKSYDEVYEDEDERRDEDEERRDER